MKTKKNAFTLIELMVTIATLMIVLMGIGVVLVDSQRGWNTMYDRVHGDVATDGHIARKAFERVVRKSSIKRYILGTSNIAVLYYNSLASKRLDMYANFRATGTKLLVDYGQVDDTGNLLDPYSTTTLARNVEIATFSVDGAGVKMILTLSDGEQIATVTCSAIRHNE